MWLWKLLHKLRGDEGMCLYRFAKAGLEAETHVDDVVVIATISDVALDFLEINDEDFWRMIEHMGVQEDLVIEIRGAFGMAIPSNVMDILEDLRKKEVAWFPDGAFTPVVGLSF